MRDYAETSTAAGSWYTAMRVVARFKATYKRVVTRIVVTNITERGPRWLYERCGRD